MTAQTSLSTIERAARAGIRGIQVVAYRDLDDRAAGGSELHVHELMSRWVEAGIDVASRTVAGSGLDRHVQRNGYTVERVGGYYSGVTRTALAGLGRQFRGSDALVEVWNGLPVMSPLWWRGPRLTLIHHLHHELWHSTYPAPIAALGSFVERRIAPWLYRSGVVATLSQSSADEIIQRTPLRADRLHVVPPGLDQRFVPGPEGRAPIVLCVARLTVAKRVDAVVRSVADIRQRIDDLQLVIVGTGPELEPLQRLAHDLGVSDAVEFAGRVDEPELVKRYQMARVLASASTSEGWGMTITEAAACGTPAVASAIVGHRDAVAPDAGILAADDGSLTSGIERMLTDRPFWDRASRAALVAAGELSWDVSADLLLQLLVDDAESRNRPR